MSQPGKTVISSTLLCARPLGFVSHAIVPGCRLAGFGSGCSRLAQRLSKHFRRDCCCVVRLSRPCQQPTALRHAVDRLLLDRIACQQGERALHGFLSRLTVSQFKASVKASLDDSHPALHSSTSTLAGNRNATQVLVNSGLAVACSVLYRFHFGDLSASPLSLHDHCILDVPRAKPYALSAT
jgi:hypothetical protein